ncbi:MAG: phosphate acetyltransferase [Patiriisocius sp.]|jgi:phosphate acetyltransferase
MTKPKIIFPENDPRVHIAARILIEQEICHPVLIGDEKVLRETLDVGEFTVIAPDPDAKDELWQAAQLVADGSFDGIVSGAVFPTSDVLRAYIKTIGVQEGVSRVTSCFLMEKGLQRYLFADCAVNIDPSAETLAETAHLCDKFAPLVGIESKVALLSFSTKGSAEHTSVDKMREALKLTQERYPEMVVDGELQVDSALVSTVGALKAPDSTINGDATVLVFPDLNAGNIAYKLVERLGEFRATGPLLLGFAKPAHDLSRGCSHDDIVSVARIAVLQAKVV